MGLVEVARSLGDEFERVAALQEREALGDVPLQLDRFHLGAVILALLALLRLLVVVELALDPLDGAVEHVDHAPEHVLGVVLQPGVGEGRDQRVVDVDHVGLDAMRLGERAVVGIVLVGPVAEELHLVEEVGKRGVLLRLVVEGVLVGHVFRSFLG